VTNFVAKSTVAGGVFGAGSLICAGACVYCIYRVVIAIRGRNVQQIEPIQETAAAKANVEMLRMIHTRLNTLLSESAPIDLEIGVNDVQLHEAIGGQLQELEQILPQMRTELAEVKASLESIIASRSVSSPSGAGLDSPASEGSVERGLLGKLDNLARRVARDQSSRNASRGSSVTSSPAGGNVSSFAAESPLPSPVSKGGPARALTFGSVNSGGTPMSPLASDGTSNPLDEEK
jgi:hypothetical protein